MHACHVLYHTIDQALINILKGLKFVMLELHWACIFDSRKGVTWACIIDQLQFDIFIHYDFQGQTPINTYLSYIS